MNESTTIDVRYGKYLIRFVSRDPKDETLANIAKIVEHMEKNEITTYDYREFKGVGK